MKDEKIAIVNGCQIDMHPINTLTLLNLIYVAPKNLYSLIKLTL